MKHFKFLAIILFAATLAFTACDGDGGGDNVINISAIPGVIVPAVGAIPVTTITETAQYSGTVTWDPADATFGSKAYTAIITLTAKTGYTLTGMAANYFTVAGTSVAATNSADSGVVTAIFPQAIPYNLRDTGPAGGLIFYINPTAETDGWKYLECAPQTTEWTGKEWGNYGTSVSGTGLAIGTGKNNTALIVAKLNEETPEFDRAAQLADALTYGGFDDWFLPSKDELWQMCWNLRGLKDESGSGSAVQNPDVPAGGVGGFADDGSYWSSSEGDAYTAWSQNFTNGHQFSNYKSLLLIRVRAVRAF